MEGQSRILKDRVQAIAFDGRRIEAQKRVRGEDDEKQEGQAHRTLNGQNPGAEFQRQVVPEDRNGGAIERQNQHPQHHGAFVVSPHAADLVEQRLGGMGVGDNILDREVGHHIGVGQRGEGRGNQDQLQHRRRQRCPHQRLVAAMGAVERNEELVQRHAGGEDQREMPDFGNHGFFAPSFHTPFSLSESASSFGM